MTDNRLIKSAVIPSESPIKDFAVAYPGGNPLVVCANWGDDVWTWDLLGDEWSKRPLADFDDGSYGIPVYPDLDHVAAAVVHEQVLFAAGGARQGLALWDLMSGDLLSGPPEFRSCVHAMALTRVDERTTLVAGAVIPEVYLWDSADPEVASWGPADDESEEEAQEPQELPGHSDDMRDLVTGKLDGRPVVVSSGRDNQILVSDLEHGELIHEWSADGVSAVALSEVDGRPVVLAATESGEVMVWDAVDGRLDGNPLTGHHSVSALDTVVVEGRTLVVTGSDDGTARIWDLAGRRQVGAPLVGHSGEIWTVTAASVDGRQVVLTAGRDGVVRVWAPMA